MPEGEGQQGATRKCQEEGQQRLWMGLGAFGAARRNGLRGKRDGEPVRTWPSRPRRGNHVRQLVAAVARA